MNTDKHRFSDLTHVGASVCDPREIAQNLDRESALKTRFGFYLRSSVFANSIFWRR
jgi:hypothetical protein